MIPTKHFKQQYGGLYTAVVPCDQSSRLHQSTLESVLTDTIRHEAKVHGAKFDAVSFRNVMKAINSGDVEILFLAAAWDLCKPKVVGATINFRSLSLQRSKNKLVTKSGIYSEDVCLLPSMIRELILQRPANMSFPDEGIGTHYIRECMAYFAENGMRGGIIPAGQTFEFAPDNTKIVKIQEQLGAILGQKNNSGLFRLNEITSAIRNKWAMPVELLDVPLGCGGTDFHNFVVHWTSHNERQRIEAGFTRGLSTFKGKSITQSQIVSNGDLPEPPIVECVLASMIKAANEEIQERGWGRLNKKPQQQRSLSIPLLGDVRQVYGALFEAQNDALFSPISSEATNLFGVTPPPMHIHALNEPEIVAGLHSLGIEKRLLGAHPSQTASLDLVKASGSGGAVRPLNLIGLEASNNPLFSLVA